MPVSLYFKFVLVVSFQTGQNIGSIRMSHSIEGSHRRWNLHHLVTRLRKVSQWRVCSHGFVVLYLEGCKFPFFPVSCRKATT